MSQSTQTESVRVVDGDRTDISNSVLPSSRLNNTSRRSLKSASLSNGHVLSHGAADSRKIEFDNLKAAIKPVGVAPDPANGFVNGKSQNSIQGAKESQRDTVLGQSDALGPTSLENRPPEWQTILDRVRALRVADNTPGLFELKKGLEDKLVRQQQNTALDPATEGQNNGE